MKYNLPKPYLSYSAIQLWIKDPTRYRKQYYESAPSFSNIYTKTGNIIHKQIEDGLLEVKNHPLEKYTSEVKIETEVCGVPVLGYIDLLNKKNMRLSDIKTGVKKKDEKPRWTMLEVIKLDQLPFYQVLIESKYGKVYPYAGLIWIETEHYNNKKGIARQKGLQITGMQKSFTRKIEKWERDKMKDLIVKTAEEVSEDYKYYKKIHG